MHEFLGASPSQDVLIRVAALESGLAVNPTADTVEVAFTNNGATPGGSGSAAWRTAAWETDNTGPAPAYDVVVRIGSSATGALRAGIYQTTIRVTHTPTIPWIDAGRIKIV